MMNPYFGMVDCDPDAHGSRRFHGLNLDATTAVISASPALPAARPPTAMDQEWQPQAQGSGVLVPWDTVAMARSPCYRWVNYAQ